MIISHRVFFIWDETSYYNMGILYYFRVYIPDSETREIPVLERNSLELSADSNKP
jgi:hypothetical protein